MSGRVSSWINKPFIKSGLVYQPIHIIIVFNADNKSMYQDSKHKTQENKIEIWTIT